MNPSTEKVYHLMQPGDLLEFDRGRYSHWGVCIGNGEIVHLTGENDGIGDGKGNLAVSFTVFGRKFDKAFVTRDDFVTVVRDGKTTVKINNSLDKKYKPIDPLEIVKRALARLGEIGYNVMFCNCEHFAKWCRYDVERSEQVEKIGIYAACAVVGGICLSVIAKGVSLALSPSKKKEEEERTSVHPI